MRFLYALEFFRKRVMPYEYNGSFDTFTCNLCGVVIHRQKEIASAPQLDAISKTNTEGIRFCI